MGKEKSIFTTLFSILFSWLGFLTIPVLLMVGCNIIDYITGLIACSYRKENLTSNKGIKGIIKKVCMWFLVIVGAMVDLLLRYASDQIGITIQLNYLIASIVAMWIICNEIISILENMVDIGVKIPPFLLPLVDQIRKETEHAMEGKEKK
ncbi:MAG TPA: phage holin family protein [Lachnospiraceae bacterium]|nr:phage holin family protein [Lachnospiraceae bacterium]